MEVKQGTAIKVPVKLVLASSGAGQTGLVYSQPTVYIQKQNGASTVKVLVSGDFTEVDATNFAGVYDLLLSATDLNTPGFLKYSVAFTDCTTYHGLIEVVGNTAAEVIDVVESHRGHHTMQGGRLVYVAPTNGNDSTGNGSRQAPYKTITAALAAVTVPHTTIIVVADNPAGQTTLVETVAWNKRYTFLRGPGRDLIIRGATSNTPTFTVSVPGAEFSGFQLESHATGSGADGIEANAADFLNVHDVFINATQGTGIELNNCSNARILHNVFQGTGVNGSGHGLIVACSGGSSSQYNEVCHNDFMDVLGDAIRITKAGAGSNSDSRICENHVHGSTSYAVNIGANVVGTQVTDNRFGTNTLGDVLDAGTDTTSLNNEQWAKDSGVTVSAINSTPVNQIADQVWNEAAADHVAAGSTGATLVNSSSYLQRLLGLTHDNGVLDQQVYEEGRLLSGRLRVYDSAANAAIAYATVPGEYATGLLFTYNVTAAYTDGLMTKYVMARV